MRGGGEGRREEGRSGAAERWAEPGAGPGQQGQEPVLQISGPLCCLLVADTGHTMKLALLPWILMLLSTIPGPGLTAGMPSLCPSDPSLFICLISQALSRHPSGFSCLSIWQSICDCTGEYWEESERLLDLDTSRGDGRSKPSPSCTHINGLGGNPEDRRACTPAPVNSAITQGTCTPHTRLSSVPMLVLLSSTKKV